MIDEHELTCNEEIQPLYQRVTDALIVQVSGEQDEGTDQV